ncbi:phytanoyl-CoA dioxygenase family protein [Actinospica durhamensis]|uniref:Phytanoyl-CoA dioxygenase family protein n=1 Tax=Actinospica durhamensis TaxID=1508375 RepID=A0A941EQJ8_9ACTN|nr:phytanoyl-CoA dioxygenase family protein [Actinospica durhamensis]MBR7835546.1 phytanoyl-CoA dioxygenase family protein [Actinospica durhamensis]
MSTRTFTLTDDERALLPGATDVEHYAEHGWYLTGKLFTDDEIAQLLEASERYYAGERDRRLPLRPPRLAYWEPSDGPVQRHNDYVHYESDAIGRILRKPLIGAVAARLAEVERIRLFQSTLIYKPPIAGEPSNVVPWHFDKHYWATCTSERMLTAFIPFHDCDERMGTITMIDGSHRWKEIGLEDSTTRHFAERDRAGLDRMLAENAAYNGAEVRRVPIEIPLGHLSFHHCRTYHGSGPNRADRPRRAVSLHLQDGANHYRRFALSDGTAVAYNHDALVRRTAAGDPDYADPEFCPQLWAGDERDLDA